MRVLTLTQPWAQLVARGAKRVETRSWTTGYRGPVAIHAGKTLPKRVLAASRGGLRGLEEVVLQDPFWTALRCRERDDGGFTGEWMVQPVDREAYAERQFFFAQVPLGKIVAVAELIDVVSVDEARLTMPAGVHPSATWSPLEHEPEFGDYSPGRFMFCLGAVRRLSRPVSYRNGQGLRRLDLEQLEGVRGLERALLTTERVA